MERERGSRLAVVDRSTAGESTRELGERNVFDCLPDSEARREIFIRRGWCVKDKYAAKVCE